MCGSISRSSICDASSCGNRARNVGFSRAFRSTPVSIAHIEDWGTCAYVTFWHDLYLKYLIVHEVAPNVGSAGRILKVIYPTEQDINQYSPEQARDHNLQNFVTTTRNQMRIYERYKQHE